MKKSSGHDRSIASWTEGPVLHLDVRGLVPPRPMVAVLTRLEGEDAPERLTVHLDREPIHLFPELEERGWDYSLEQIDAGYYRVHISRARDGR